MKKIIVLLIAIVTSFQLLMAQKDVTTFLGIPVDGFKPEMKQKLIAKGFTYDNVSDCFEGEFNGTNVNLFVATNNNKVWRIAVADKNPISETDIKIRFNNLCYQFAKNKKYTPMNMGEKDYTIPEDENISYEMVVNKKRYEAAYYQEPIPELVDTLALQKYVKDAVLEKYTQEQIDNPTEEQAKDMDTIAQSAAITAALDLMRKKIVWFIINEYYGKYYITIYYDNEYNHSNGEDL